jgi:hypothetical protein
MVEHLDIVSTSLGRACLTNKPNRVNSIDIVQSWYYGKCAKIRLMLHVQTKTYPD